MCEDPIPPLDGGQLLRTCREATQKAGDAGQNIGRPLRIGVGAGNAQRRLARVTQALSDTGQEQRPAGDRLKMPSGLGEPDEQVPPVVDKGDETGRKPAPGEIMRREPAPPPVVLQFIEGILAIRPVAIELAECENLGVERSHQRRVLVHLAAFDLDERKSELASDFIPMLVGKLLLDAPAQKNDTASP
jgi:hypothetical protein